jgi:hypothetical protein
MDEHSTWKTLYKMGAIAPLITITIYIIQILFTLGAPYPDTMDEWFRMFQRSKILGLLYLNTFDIFSIAILGVMFLALYIALRNVNPSFMLIAAFFAFLGVAIFVSSRADMVTATLNLSEQYAAATTEPQQLQILAAGQAMNAITEATVETIGFLFIAVSGLITSVVTLQSDNFNKITAYIGILGCIITIADQVFLVISPSIAIILLPINGLLWLIWWLLVSCGLFRLSQ